jgi:hypothetical protein
MAPGVFGGSDILELYQRVLEVELMSCRRLIREVQKTLRQLIRCVKEGEGLEAHDSIEWM